MNYAALHLPSRFPALLAGEMAMEAARKAEDGVVVEAALALGSSYLNLGSSLN